MSDAPKLIEWNRLLVEGVVIVASILLAFAIDASWESRLEQQAEKGQLLSVLAELETNAERIQDKLDALYVAEAAAIEILSWTGPEPQPVTETELTAAFTRMYSIGSFALLRGASNTYLSGAQSAAISHEDVRKSIADWYEYGDELERQYSWLREVHASLGAYLADTVPMLYFDASHPAMRGIRQSRFPMNHATMLADQRFESRVSLYLIRIKFFQEQAAELIDSHGELIAQIRDAVDD
ncbi:MAG: hypothetical protein OEX74_15225 [Gammaproteobacteria bacterium]|nr:hypothetical protein [Gammaproteobacteria bacterium]MDH5262753.1 hypothetical protein [Gammaproteobacteria bacterium]